MVLVGYLSRDPVGLLTSSHIHDIIKVRKRAFTNRVYAVTEAFDSVQRECVTSGVDDCHCEMFCVIGRRIDAPHSSPLMLVYKAF